MYELKYSRKSTRHKKIVARTKQQLKKVQEFFCVYFRVILCYHSHNRKVKLEIFIEEIRNFLLLMIQRKRGGEKIVLYHVFNEARQD